MSMYVDIRRGFAGAGMASLLAVVLAGGPPPLAAQAGQQAQPDSGASFTAAFHLAQQALGAGDHGAVRLHLRAALGVAPDVGIALYYLARSEVQLGDTAAALDVLARLARQGMVRDIAADSALLPLFRAPRFAAIAAEMARNAEPLVRSEAVAALPGADFMPEGVAWDAADGFLYIGSLNAGGVLRMQRNGLVTPFLDGRDAGGDQVIGLRVDAERRLLWIAALAHDTAAPPFARGVGGRAFLSAFELATGQRVVHVEAPDDGRPHLLNDMVVTPSGDVYVTDSEGGALYRLRRDGTALEQVHGGDADFTYPNGIAITADGSRLFVAHVEGISTLALGDDVGRALVRVAAAPGVPTGGIDGMYACGDGLLAVQALTGFHQVTRFTLSGGSITAAVAVERRHPLHDTPTTGAIAGDDFFYIADAQLRRLQPDGSVSEQGARAATVLRLPLNGVCR